MSSPDYITPPPSAERGRRPGLAALIPRAAAPAALSPASASRRAAPDSSARGPRSLPASPRGSPRAPPPCAARGKPGSAPRTAPSLGVGTSITAGISPPPFLPLPAHPHALSHSLLPGTPQRSALAACAAPRIGGAGAFYKLFFPFLFFFTSSPPERTHSEQPPPRTRRAEQGGWPRGASRGCSSSCVSTAGRDIPLAPPSRPGAVSRCGRRCSAEVPLQRRRPPRRQRPLRRGGAAGSRGLPEGRRAGGRRSAPLCPQTPQLVWLPSKKLKTSPGSPLTPKRISLWCGRTGRRASWRNSPPSSSSLTTCGPATTWM